MKSKLLKLTEKTFIRFLIAGVFNTFFGFFSYTIAVLCGAEIWLALLIGAVAGVVFNFITTGGYAFRMLSIQRFPLFLICYVVVYIMNLGAFRVLSDYITNVILLQFILTIPLALLSYFLMSMIVFKKK